MMKFSLLKNEMMKSPLGGQSVLRPKGNHLKKSLITTVILTSLVDAFSILVIYLIVNTATSSEIINPNRDILLPKAAQSTQIEKGTVVKVEKNRYYVDEKPVSLKSLPQVLLKIQQSARAANKKISIIIQADQNDGFSKLNPILVSSATSGFEKIKFAVIQSGDQR